MRSLAPVAVLAALLAGCQAPVRCPALAPPSAQPVISRPPPRPAEPPTSAGFEADYRATAADQIAIIRSLQASSGAVRELGAMDSEVRRALAPWHRRHAKPTAGQVEKAVVSLSALKAYLADQLATTP